MVVNTTNHIQSPFTESIPTYRIPVVRYIDSDTLLLHHIPRVAAAIDHLLATTQKSVIIHCVNATCRGPTVMAGYLVLRRGMSVENAIQFVRHKVPKASRNTHPSSSLCSRNSNGVVIPHQKQISLHHTTMFPPRHVLDRVWIGGITTATNEAFMRDHNIGLIINCTRHIDAPFRHDIPTYRIPIDDSPEWHYLFRQHIAIAAGEIHKTLQATDKSVLVHCHAGVSRSATVVAAYLILYRGMTSNKAIEHIQRHKPETFRPYPVFLEILQQLDTIKGRYRSSRR